MFNLFSALSDKSLGESKQERLKYEVNIKPTLESSDVDYIECVVLEENQNLSKIVKEALELSGGSSAESEKLLLGETIDPGEKNYHKIQLQFKDNNPKSGWVEKIIFYPKPNLNKFDDYPFFNKASKKTKKIPR